MLDINVLKYYYKDIGNKNEFIKPLFIRLIKIKIIDRNTKYFLQEGFKWFSETNQSLVNVPCNDSNWNEYNTFKEGLKYGIINYPMSLKLEHNIFNIFKNEQDFEEFYKKVIEFRIDTIKRGWAIKCGLTYSGIDYDELENLTEKELLAWVDPRKNAPFKLDALKEKDLFE